MNTERRSKQSVGTRHSNERVCVYKCVCVCVCVMFQEKVMDAKVDWDMNENGVSGKKWWPLGLKHREQGEDLEGEFGVLGKGQTMLDLGGRKKKLGFYSKCSGELWAFKGEQLLRVCSAFCLFLWSRLKKIVMTLQLLIISKL